MTTRPEGLEAMASKTGEQLVSVTNHARSMTYPKVPAPYNTTLGRGHGHAHMKAEWLCSTFLAMALNDPKNAAWQVPACGNLRAARTRLVRKYAQDEGAALDHLAKRRETSIDIPASITGYWFGLTLFDVLVGNVKGIAVDWNGPRHQLWRAGFGLTVVLGKSMWAEIEEVGDVEKDGTISWLNTPFFAQTTKEEVSAVTPLRRKVEILLPHIELLATLYADTLKHEGALPASTPSETAPAPADVGAETESAGSLPGEPAPSDCQPSACAIDDTANSTHPKTNGLDNRGSNPGVCVSSSGKSVRASSAPPARRRHHGLKAHHHAPA